MDGVSDIKGILFDLDGVFYVGDQMIIGADALVSYLIEKQVACRYVTNTTTQSRASIAEKLQSMGLPIQSHEITSTPSAALAYLKQQGYRSCYLLVAESVKHEFDAFPQDDDRPDAVVIGDIGEAWTYSLLNRIFGMLMSGSRLIALHKNKFWQTQDGMRMDIGAFVAGLEYVSGQQAVVIGKPSPAFFQLAVDQLMLPAGQVMMVGDDIDSDVGGAQRAGLKGVLVRSGKYRAEYAEASSVRPDWTIDTVADLIDLI
ncbi:MAG: TIGR01458 family HAD-type hydrolase [Gammaproteobacteria bacterium]